jgi:hypothetical protein
MVALADSFDVVQPEFSPDGLLMVAGRGKRSTTIRRVVTNTFDPALAPVSEQKIIANYPDTTFAENGVDPILAPRLSPDGTRLALKSKQVWAARRNMNLPPKITQVGTQGVVDSTAKVSINAVRGLPTTITVSSTDPEGDTITYSAYFLADGMSFSSSTHTLSWTPAAAVGSIFYVKFVVTTPSGGVDAIIVVLTVTSGLQPAPWRMAASGLQPDGPNPTSGRFAMNTPFVRGLGATLSVFDLTGRRIAVVHGKSGSRLLWEGKDVAGTPVAPGIYLYRSEVGLQRLEGKVVVVR